MSKHLKIFLFSLFLSMGFHLNAQSEILGIHPDSIGQNWEKPLSGWAHWNNELPVDIEIEKVVEQSFQILTDSMILYEKENPNFWFKYSLSNSSVHDSLFLFLIFDRHVRKALLNYKVNGIWKKLKAGKHTFHEELAFKNNSWAIPISIAPLDTIAYFLQLSKETSKRDSLHYIKLVTPEQEIKIRNSINVKGLGQRIFNSFFLGAILIFTLFTLIYFIGKRDKAYLFYSLYLFCLFIFYFKNFEADNRTFMTFSMFAKWHTNVETITTYASFIFYIHFIRYFLNIKDADPKLDKLLKFGSWLFLFVLFVDIIIQYKYGTKTSLELMKIIYFPFLLFSLYILFALWKKRLSSYSKYIIIGTLILLMGIIPFRVAQLLGIDYDNYAWGALRTFFFESGIVYWYNTKLGLLAEVACFMIGLAWKTQQERIEMVRLVSRLNLMESSSMTVSSKPLKPIIQREVNQHQDDFLKKADLIIEEKHTHHTFLPSILAADLHISYSHCAHLIKKKTGLSISLYIQQFRLKKAKELLLSSDLPIKRVAYQSGFNNPAYFSRLFKEVFSTSPSNYRKNKGL